MKASELITVLQGLVATHGDLQVGANSDEWDQSIVLEKNFVWIQQTRVHRHESWRDEMRLGEKFIAIGWPREDSAHNKVLKSDA